MANETVHLHAVLTAEPRVTGPADTPARAVPAPPARSVRSALLFVLIGLVLYGIAYYAAERLVYRTGHMNAFFKIEQASPASFDWVILGSSHAMPLDFADFNAFMERETGRHILNLAMPGAGVVYNRFALEYFLARHRMANVLYAVDSFAFYARQWNEERFADAKLTRRTPFTPSLAAHTMRYVSRGLIDPPVLLDYVSGFSKINNRERFERDVWEGETKFERKRRPSALADKQRIAYLYPFDTIDESTFARYVGHLGEIVELARSRGLALTVIKMPVPRSFRALIPGEAAFDRVLAAELEKHHVPFDDFTLTANDADDFFDSDHLNRAGLTRFFQRSLRSILERSRQTT